MAEDISNVKNDLKAVPQTSSEQFFKKWKMWWEGCIAVQRDYFEGNNVS
jgi:hypothetical protein